MNMRSSPLLPCGTVSHLCPMRLTGSCSRVRSVRECTALLSYSWHRLPQVPTLIYAAPTSSSPPAPSPPRPPSQARPPLPCSTLTNFDFVKHGEQHHDRHCRTTWSPGHRPHHQLLDADLVLGRRRCRFVSLCQGKLDSIPPGPSLMLSDGLQSRRSRRPSSSPSSRARTLRLRRKA